MTQHYNTQHNNTEFNYAQLNDTQHNDTQHNDTQHYDTQHNYTKHNDTQHNDAKNHNSQHHYPHHYDSIVTPGAYLKVEHLKVLRSGRLWPYLQTLEWSERSAMSKHSSLIQTFVNLGRRGVFVPGKPLQSSMM